MLRIRDIDVPFEGTTQNRSTKKTYLLTGIFFLLAAFQWFFILAFVQSDMSRWSTVLIMSAFLLVTVFHSLSPLRYVYPYNYILMLIITELMILGTGAMCSIQSLELMVAVIAIIFFIWICLVAFGAVVHQYVQLNPLCFLTIIFLSFMATVMLIYMQLVLDTQTVLHLCRILVCYSIVAVIIYHSAILHSSEASLFQEDYILSGLLLFVDYICLFILGIMYVQYKNDTNIKPGQVT